MSDTGAGLFRRDDTPYFAHVNKNHFATTAYADSYRRAAEKLLIGMVEEINAKRHDDAMIFQRCSSTGITWSWS